MSITKIYNTPSHLYNILII